MKIKLILLFTLISTTNVFSQSYENSIDNLLSVSTTKNSYTFYNSNDFTIKIKKVEKTTNRIVGENLIPPKSFITYNENSNIIRQYIENYNFGVFYDAECLQRDLNHINELKKQRIDSDKDLKILTNFINSTIVYISESEPNSVKGKYAKKYLDLKSSYDRFKSWRESGVIETEIERYKDKLSGEIINKLVDKNFSDFQNRAIAKGVIDFALSDFETNTDLSDLDAKINSLISLSSNNRIKGYYLSYDEHFKSKIDIDGDWVNNDFDECIDIPGLEKYNGCTKKLFYNSRKKTYELAIEGGVIPYVNYNYKNKDGFENIYDNFSFQNSKFLRIINYFNTNKNNMFYIPLQYSFSEKYNGVLEEKVNSTTNTSYSKMSFKSFDLNIGYLWKLFGNKSFNTCFTFEGGVNYSIFNITERKSGSFDTNGNIILFNFDDVEDELTSINAGLGFIIDFDYVSLDIRYNSLLSFGKKETDTTPQSELKNKMNGSTVQLGLKIPIYRKYIKK